MSQAHPKTKPTEQNVIRSVVFGFSHTINMQLTRQRLRVPWVSSSTFYAQCPIFWKGERNIWAQQTHTALNLLFHLKRF